jgi:hypothetical protein
MQSCSSFNNLDSIDVEINAELLDKLKHLKFELLLQRSGLNTGNNNNNNNSSFCDETPTAVREKEL